MTLALVAKLIISYLLGSVSGSLVLGRLRGVDIRTQGSGNAGGTNALRTQGWRFALGVVLIDVGKGALAAWIGASAIGGAPVDREAAALACVFAAIFGHVWPVFHGFRGGKGAATLVGGLAASVPLLLVPVLAVWGVVLVLTGYVGLATVLAAASLVPAAYWLVGAVPSSPLFVFAVGAAAYIAWTHRENLARLARGTENRFERVRIFARRPR
jgi:glycerol-3-phosphate acyltransferase PlsY